MNYLKSVTLIIVLVFITTCLQRTSSNGSNTALIMSLLQQVSRSATESFIAKPIGIKEMEITFPKSSYFISDKFSFNAIAKVNANRSRSIAINVSLDKDKITGALTNKVIVPIPTFEFGPTSQLIIETDASNVVGKRKSLTSQSKDMNALNLNQFIGYLKAKKPSRTDLFGSSLAISDDGETVAIGVPGDDSSTNGVNSDDGDDSMQDSGAVYIYKKDKDTRRWVQEAYLKAENAGKGDEFGFSIALNGNGDFLAVGAPGEDNGMGTDGADIRGNRISIVRNIVKPSTIVDNDDLSQDSGAVYIFRKISGVWEKQFYVKPTNTAARDRFGASVSLSKDGKMLVVGAPNKAVEITRDIAADPTKPTGDPLRTARNGVTQNFSNVGSAYIFQYRSDLTPIPHWDEFELIPTAKQLNGVPGMTPIPPPPALPTPDVDRLNHHIVNDNDTSLGTGDLYGTAVHIARDINDTNLYFVFVGSPGQGRYRNPLIPTEHSEWRPETKEGRVHIFNIQIPPDGATADDKMSGGQVGLNVVGTINITAGARRTVDLGGVNNNKAGTAAGNPATPIIASVNSGKYDGFGSSISSNSNGSIVIIGAPKQDSLSRNGDDNKLDSGVAYIFARNGTSLRWEQVQAIKSSSNAFDEFGSSVFMNGNARKIAISAPYEDSSSAGLIGNQEKNDLKNAGAIYVYDRVGTTNQWTQSIYLKAGNPGSGDNFGKSVVLAADTIAVGSPGEDGSFGLSTYLGNGNIILDNNKKDSGAVYLY